MGQHTVLILVEMGSEHMSVARLSTQFMPFLLNQKKQGHMWASSRKQEQGGPIANLSH